MGRADAVARHPALNHNGRRAIYKLICAYGPLSCRDLAGMMGCKGTDIAGHINKLHSDRLIQDAGPSPTGKIYQERKDEQKEPSRRKSKERVDNQGNEAAIRLLSAWHGRA